MKPNRKGYIGSSKWSFLEELFEKQISKYRLPEPTRFYNFHGWEIDYAWTVLLVGVEIQGGTYLKKGAHVYGKGFKRDCMKRNKAQLEGWILLTADKDMVQSHEFMNDVKKALTIRLKCLR